MPDPNQDRGRGDPDRQPTHPPEPRDNERKSPEPLSIFDTLPPPDPPPKKDSGGGEGES